jgi:hypothetical protein
VARRQRLSPPCEAKIFFNDISEYDPSRFTLIERPPEKTPRTFWTAECVELKNVLEILFNGATPRVVRLSEEALAWL